MPSGLHHKVRLNPILIQLNPLIDHVPIPNPIQTMPPSLRRHKLRQRHASPRVGHHRAPRVLPEHNGRHQSNEAVSVDGIAAAVDHPAAVNVRVEHHPEVGLVAEDSGPGERHCDRVLGVGDVVGKHAVGLEVDAAGGVGAELVQHVPCEEASGAVSGVHYYLQMAMYVI